MLRIAFYGMLAIWLAGCGAAPAPAPLFLGHVATLSGGDAKAGHAAELGIRFSLEELGPKASEGLLGRPVVVRHVDAAGNLDNLEAQAARLVSINKVLGLLGGLTKDEALRLDRARVPVLSPCGFRSAGMSDLLFTTGLSPTRQGQMLADFLVEQAPAAGTLIVDSRRDESVVFAEQFRRAWSASSLKKAATVQPAQWHELSLPRDANLAEAVGAAAKSPPKIIVFAGSADDFENLRRVWGPSVPRLVYAGDDGAVADAKVAPGQTIWLATAFALAPEMTRCQEFAKKYREANRVDPDVHAVLAYDNVRLLIESIKRAQSPAPEKIREELLKLKDFPGLTGSLAFARDQHLQRPAFVARFEGDGRVPTVLKTYQP